MTTLIETDEEEMGSERSLTTRGRASRIAPPESWGRSCAFLGAAVWAGLVVLARAGIARMGAIELMFLFAVLVIVPLGLELGRVIGGDSTAEKAARWFQPVGAGFAVASMGVAPGRTAGLVAGAWLMVCLLVAGSGVLGVIRALRSEAHRSVWSTFLLGVAQADLAVGGAWLVASRLGMRPMGIQEPIELLTAVHFHFAGFATAVIAAATVFFQEHRGQECPRHMGWLWRITVLVVVLPFVVAAGFVISPALKMGAATLFSASVAVLAVCVRIAGKEAEDPMSRVLLQVAAAAVFAGMVLAGVYAIADFLGSDVLTIPQMARTHGLLNAMGFCLCGLLGWNVELGVRGQGSGVRS